MHFKKKLSIGEMRILKEIHREVMEINKKDCSIEQVYNTSQQHTPIALLI